MSEVNEEVAEEPAEKTPEEAADTSPEPAELEERARRMGWRPADEYNGPESRWVDADTFIERGETELPVLRERLRRQDAQLVAQGKDMKNINNDMAEMKGMMARSHQRGYEEAKAELEAQQRQAVELGDVHAYDTAQSKIEALEVPPPPAQRQQAENEIPPEVTAFTEKHTWYSNDPGMTTFTDAAFASIRVSMPQSSLTDQLAALETQVKRAYPEKFENPRRGAPGEVEGGNAPPRKKSGKTWASLPSAAKAACDRMVAREMCTRDEYLKEYEWDD